MGIMNTKIHQNTQDIKSFIPILANPSKIYTPMVTKLQKYWTAYTDFVVKVSRKGVLYDNFIFYFLIIMITLMLWRVIKNDEEDKFFWNLFQRIWTSVELVHNNT